MNLLCQFKCVQKILKKSFCSRPSSDGAGTVASLNLVKKRIKLAEKYFCIVGLTEQKEDCCALTSDPEQADPKKPTDLVITNW